MLSFHLSADLIWVHLFDILEFSVVITATGVRRGIILLLVLGQLKWLAAHNILLHDGLLLSPLLFLSMLLYGFFFEFAEVAFATNGAIGDIKDDEQIDCDQQ